MGCKYLLWNGTHLSCRQPSSSFQVCLVSCHLCFVAEISSGTCHWGKIISILIYLFNCSSYLPLPSIWISGRLSTAPLYNFFCPAVILRNFVKSESATMRGGFMIHFREHCREQQCLRALRVPHSQVTGSEPSLWKPSWAPTENHKMGQAGRAQWSSGLSITIH